MKTKKIIFVFRKPNKGNFSIEKVYNEIYKNLQSKASSFFAFQKISLKYNYDFITFISCFFKALFSKKYIVHFTGGCHYMLLAFPFKQRILTIHDIYHFKNFKGIKGWFYDLFYICLPVYFSHKIVAVSNHTKKQLLKKLSVAEEKIEVIPNPLLIPQEKIKIRKRHFSKKIPLKILQIGDKPLKNYKRLIDATLNLNVCYNFVHSNPIRIELFIKNYKIEQCSTVYSNLSDEDMYEQYHENDVLFYASEAEGFGLPIIEAQAFGLPVITSNIAPMNKIGKGSILVNPFSIEDITRGFNELFETNVFESLFNTSQKKHKKYEINNVVKMYLKPTSSVSLGFVSTTSDSLT